MINDYIVPDSSIYEDNDSYALENRADATLKVGVVRDTVITKGGDVTYIVEVWLGGKYTPIRCVRTSRFGGIYNYEEFTHRGFEPDGTSGSDGLMDHKQGDIVLVAYLLGDSREGAIVGSFNHAGRPRRFDDKDGVVYESEFNGVNKSITKDGEYKVTFRGLQTNIAELDKPASGKPIPAPEYDDEVGTSYYQFDKTGSFTVSDNATENHQSIFIDKPNGKTVITSGKTSLVIDKASESYTITNKVTTFDTADQWNLNTTETNIKSNDVNVEASNIKTKGEWKMDGNMEIKGNIKQTGNTDVTGNFSTSGTTNLAGGANALVYDIVLTIGTGNLGAPVISNHTFLKTVKTKAT